MPFTPVVAGHLIEAKVYTSFENQMGLNVVHMKVNTATAGLTLNDVVGQVEADWNGSWKAWLNADAEWRGVGLRDLTVNPLEVEVFSSSQRGPGTGGGALPAQLCGLITKRTAIAGPKGRGRMYVPFPGDNMTGGAEVALGGLTVLQAIIDDIKGPEAETSGGFTLNWTLVLRTPVVGGDSFSSTPLTFIGPETGFATQRRRSRYGTLNQLPGPLT